MCACANVGATAELAGALPAHAGMEMALTESHLPPLAARGTPVEVVDVDLHPQEPPVANRPSIRQRSCAVLKFMPTAIHVRISNWNENFLEDESRARRAQGPDLTGGLAAMPASRSRSRKPAGAQKAASVTRTQMPLLLQKQRTFHGI